MKYKELLSVTLTHIYFPNGNGRTFRFEPTEGCARQMRRFSLMYRATPDGFKVVYPCRQGSQDLPARPIDEEIRFDYAIYTTDPHLLNYSNLPFTSPAQNIYHFSNLNQQTNPSDASSLSLSANGSEQVSENDLASSRPNVFSEPYENVGGALENEAGNVMENCLEFKDNKVFINLHHKPSGLYTLKENGDPERRFYVDNALFNSHPFGIVNLHVAQGVIEEYQFVNSGQIGNTEEKLPIPGRDYTIEIDARTTLWRYHVVRKFSKDHDLDKLNIKNEANASSPLKAMGVKFEKYEGEDVGENEAVFISNKPIPSSEKGYSTIVLTKGMEKIPLIPNLPNPDVTAVSVEEGETYSDIFVYI